MIYQILNADEVKHLEKELQTSLPGSAKDLKKLHSTFCSDDLFDRPIKMQPSDPGNIVLVIKPEDSIEVIRTERRKGFLSLHAIYYVIRNFVRGRLPGFEVLVDNWPLWSCIILRPQSEQQVPKYFSHTYLCHAKSVSSLKYFIQRPGVIDWSQPVIFTGVPNDVVPVISEISRKHGATVTSKESRFMYCWTKKEPPPLPQVPDNIHLGTLDQKHVETMKDDWMSTRYREDLEGYFSSVVEYFDSSCLTDKDGNLLAYICMQYNGSMAMLYIKPEYRQCGYFNILLSDLTRKRLARHEVGYAFIPVQDTSLIKLAREFGFEWVPQGNMTWIRYNPPAHFGRISNKGINIEMTQKINEDPLYHLKINAIPLTTL